MDDDDVDDDGDEDTVTDIAEYPEMDVTDVVIAVCSALVLTLDTAAIAVLAPVTEYAMVSAPYARRRELVYSDVPDDVSVTDVIVTVTADVLEALMIAVERAAVRLVTAAVVSVDPENEDVGSAESTKVPVTVEFVTHVDAPANDVVPDAHDVHDVAPADEYVPAAQIKHADTEDL